MRLNRPGNPQSLLDVPRRIRGIQRFLTLPGSRGQAAGRRYFKLGKTVTGQFLIAAVFCCLFPVLAVAEAPVVDDSENFAILDDQSSKYDEPAVTQGSNAARFDDGVANDERPLAHDDSSSRTQKPVEVIDKVQSMQQEIQELRGQLEVQSHDLKVLKDQQLAFYKDLDARLQQGPTGQEKTALPKAAATELSLNQSGIAAPNTPITNAPTLPAIVPAATSNGNPADEQLNYMAAYELVRNKKFDQAIPAMQTFLTKYPHGGYTANAEYWLGELYMVKKSYPDAIQHFEVVLNQYPSCSKTAASLLKIGYALAASGKAPEAKVKLNEVIKKYPDTQTARLAATKLQSLNVR